MSRMDTMDSMDNMDGVIQPFQGWWGVGGWVPVVSLCSTTGHSIASRWDWWNFSDLISMGKFKKQNLPILPRRGRAL